MIAYVFKYYIVFSLSLDPRDNWKTAKTQL